MNENIDLTKILRDCPKGWKFWSPLFGEVKFDHIVYSRIEVVCAKIHRQIVFNTDGKYEMWAYSDNNGNYLFSDECLLFPSKEQRDWSKFTAPWYKKEKFDPNTLQPFDKVLVRDDTCKWKVDFYSYKDESDAYPYVCVGYFYTYCIPYNDETKHLVGTTGAVPEYYRYWED